MERKCALNFEELQKFFAAGPWAALAALACYAVVAFIRSGSDAKRESEASSREAVESAAETSADLNEQARDTRAKLDAQAEADRRALQGDDQSTT
jgi:hypothetical protein